MTNWVGFKLLLKQYALGLAERRAGCCEVGSRNRGRESHPRPCFRRGIGKDSVRNQRTRAPAPFPVAAPRIRYLRTEGLNSESGRNMGYAFINFWDVDACRPSENFDSMVLVLLVPLSRMVLEVFAVSLKSVAISASVNYASSVQYEIVARKRTYEEFTFLFPRCVAPAQLRWFSGRSR